MERRGGTGREWKMTRGMVGKAKRGREGEGTWIGTCTFGFSGGGGTSHAISVEADKGTAVEVDRSARTRPVRTCVDDGNNWVGLRLGNFHRVVGATETQEDTVTALRVHGEKKTRGSLWRFGRRRTTAQECGEGEREGAPAYLENGVVGKARR